MKHAFRPIFIAGYPRSGTTLFHSLVCTSPEVNPFAKECSWLTKIVEAYAHGKATFHVHTESYFDSPETFAAYNAQLVRGILADFWRRLDSPAVLALKDPELLPLIPEVAELVPDATLAVLVRDVRDVAASQVERIRKQRSDPAWYDSGYVLEQAARYSATYGRLLEHAPALAGRLVCIRYETLVQSTPLARLEELLGLSGLDMSKLWRRSRFDITDFKNDEAYSKLFGTAISSTNVGRYLPVLAPEDVAKITSSMDVVERLFSLCPKTLA